MCKKQLVHLVMVSLKYFFDLDPTFSSHMMLTALVILGLVRLYAGAFFKGFHSALLDVKDDVSTLPSEIVALRDRWNGSTVREALSNSVRSFRENVANGDINNWKLK